MFWRRPKNRVADARCTDFARMNTDLPDWRGTVNPNWLYANRPVFGSISKMTSATIRRGCHLGDRPEDRAVGIQPVRVDGAAPVGQVGVHPGEVGASRIRYPVLWPAPEHRLHGADPQ